MATVIVRPTVNRHLSVWDADYGVYILKSIAGMGAQFAIDDVVVISHSWTRDCNNKKVILLKNPAITATLNVGGGWHNHGRLERITGEIVYTP